MKYAIQKTITTFAALASLTASAAHMQVQSIGTLGILPGEDPSSAVLLGQGHDTITLEGMGHCVDLGELKTQSGNTDGRIAEFQIEEIRSETDLRERLGISATLAMMAALYGNPTGRMNFVHESRVNTQNRYLLVKSRVANQLEIASKFAFSADAQELLERTGSDEDAFVQACGNEFVYSRRTGVAFYALLEFLTITHEQARRFDAAAEGNYNGWRGVIDLDASLGRFAGIAETRIRMIQLGGTRSFPQLGDLEEFARTYPSLVESSLAGAVTLELVTKNYGGVTPTFLAPDLRKTRARAVTVEELARNREKVEDLRRAIDYIRGNLPFYQYDRKLHDFGRWLTELKNFSDANDDIARSCLVGNWDWCSVPPTHKLPDIQLPIRKLK
jgi:hypothetical protein